MICNRHVIIRNRCLQKLLSFSFVAITHIMSEREVDVTSWESRWAEYLDAIAASERARDEEEGREECGSLPGGGLPSQGGSNGMGQKGFASASHRPEFVDVSEEAVPDLPEPEIDWRKRSEPTRKPRRPGPPGWEQNAEQREQEQMEREQKRRIEQEEREQQRKQQEEKRRQKQAEERSRREEARRQEEEQQQQYRQHFYHRQQQRQQQQQQQRQHEQHYQEQYREHRQQYSHHKPRQPQTPGGPASARTDAKSAPPPTPRLGRFFDSFAAFDQAFTEWEALAARAEVLHLAEVPFPPKKDPAGLVEAGLLRGASDESRRKKMVRSALLRWHPDKWMAMTSKVPAEEHGELAKRLGIITQALVEQKDLA